MAVVILDTSVVIAFALAERDVNFLESLFKQIKARKIKALIPSIVFAEIFAILWRMDAMADAVRIEEYLDDAGVEAVSVTKDMAILGGLLKAKYAKEKKGFSYADGILVAAGIMNNASVLTYDSELYDVKEVSVSDPVSLLRSR